MRRERETLGQLATGQRFEGSITGEVLISAFVAVAVLIGVVWNLPDAQFTSTLKPTLAPIASATGLEQQWRMYAPEPIRRLEFVSVHVTLADGTDRTWNLQRDNPVTGQFVWYHWQKLKENTVRDASMRSGLCHWVVDQVTSPADHPIRVQMILRTEELLPPGAIGTPKTATETLYDEKLTDHTPTDRP